CAKSRDGVMIMLYYFDYW
nr:immunoglobulin heavy chain junction region [Macaca mulatta]MOW20491.1 immunoglobulin heavy chain junction region [Macaca mulatta]MOW20783.1 immunoglobulin heavy chain junction region [Macaca mulatta]MOW21644.1 immunoglobulin heavy chain junction region [Macaca mulatta]